MILKTINRWTQSNLSIIMHPDNVESCTGLTTPLAPPPEQEKSHCSCCLSSSNGTNRASYPLRPLQWYCFHILKDAPHKSNASTLHLLFLCHQSSYPVPSRNSRSMPSPESTLSKKKAPIAILSTAGHPSILSVRISTTQSISSNI